MRHASGCTDQERQRIDVPTVTCPLHSAQFNIWTGAVLRGPVKGPLKTYRVTIEGEVERVDVPLAHAVQSE
jgi:nitrite reductase/ring-hydroxylating ferredoxin subunit